MSAYIVADAHIDALISYAIKTNVSFYFENGRTDITRNSANDIGQILLDENYRSVNHRYRGEEGDAPRYKIKPHAVLEPVVILKLINCLDYQSCETDDWKASKAYAVLDAIKDQAIRNLPGYEAAPWGIR